MRVRTRQSQLTSRGLSFEYELSIGQPMIPIESTIPLQRIPWVTYALLGTNIILFWYEISLGPLLESFLIIYGWVPARFSVAVTQGQFPTLFPLLTSIFLHGSWIHLGGNLFFLYFFGRDVEDRLGHIGYMSFFCLGGSVAMLVQTYISPFSQVPMIGASGAIAAVAGAYCVFFPSARVLTLIPIPFAFRMVRVPTVGYVLVWLGLLMASGLYLVALNGRFSEGGAWGAHLGGFLAGLIFGPLSLSVKRRNVRRKRSKYWRPDSSLIVEGPRSILR